MPTSHFFWICIYMIAGSAMVITLVHKEYKKLDDFKPQYEIAICEAQAAIDGIIEWQCKKGYKK